MSSANILVWLPSPMGDAIMATAGLRSLRNQFSDAKIYFCGNKTVCDVLSGCAFADEWIVLDENNPFAIAKKLKKYNFDTAILFKNSFASALAVFLAGIKTRAGYVREGRGFFLTEKLYPKKRSLSKYKPVSVIDYYLALVSWFGADVSDMRTELCVAEADKQAVLEKFGPNLTNGKPVVIIVPGGAFGPSKMWPAERFAKTIDFLVEKFSANVFVSVSPNEQEIKVAEKICSLANNPVINLGSNPVSLGQLKALFSLADLVVSNDTGPRHIAIALGRKIVTLFGPNNPAWTENGYADEIKIAADVSCSPCDKPVCKANKHYCMESITAEAVCAAAEKLLSGGGNG